MPPPPAPGKRALGRGLAALLPPRPSEATRQAAAGAGSGVAELAVADIDANPSQPRQAFDEGALEELAASIRAHGVLQPIAVAPRTTAPGAAGGLTGGATRYVIVAGERRWRAAVLAGRKTVPAIVMDGLDERGMLECALVENLQREDLTAMEEARAFRALMDGFGLTQEEVAQRLGRARSAIANTLRLLKLHREFAEGLEAGLISAGHAKALLGLERETDRRRLYAEILAKGLSVRQAEDWTHRQAERDAADRRRKAAGRPAGEAARADALACRVKFTPKDAARGRIEIFYDSLEELDRVLETLGVRP